jgi:hypothetical protein
MTLTSGWVSVGVLIVQSDLSREMGGQINRNVQIDLYKGCIGFMGRRDVGE